MTTTVSVYRANHTGQGLWLIFRKIEIPTTRKQRQVMRHGSIPAIRSWWIRRADLRNALKAGVTQMVGIEIDARLNAIDGREVTYLVSPSQAPAFKDKMKRVLYMLKKKKVPVNETMSLLQNLEKGTWAEDITRGSVPSQGATLPRAKKRKNKRTKTT